MYKPHFQIQWDDFRQQILKSNGDIPESKYYISMEPIY